MPTPPFEANVQRPFAWFWLSLSLELLSVGVATAQEGIESGLYYLSDGHGQLMMVDDRTPQFNSVREWQIRLYPRGESYPAGRPWGLLFGKTRESVLSQLKDCQHFEAAAGKWTGLTSRLTYFNPKGPIALRDFEPTSLQKPGVGSALNRLNKGWQQWRDLKAVFDATTLMLDQSKGSPDGNPYAGIGSTLEEYGQSLTRAAQKLSEAKQLLAATVNPSMAAVTSALDDAGRDLTESTNTSRRLGSHLAPTTSPNAARTASSGSLGRVTWPTRYDTRDAGPLHQLGLVGGFAHAWNVEANGPAMLWTQRTPETRDSRQHGMVVAWKCNDGSSYTEGGLIHFNGVWGEDMAYFTLTCTSSPQAQVVSVSIKGD